MTDPTTLELYVCDKCGYIDMRNWSHHIPNTSRPCESTMTKRTFRGEWVTEPSLADELYEEFWSATWVLNSPDITKTLRQCAEIAAARIEDPKCGGPGKHVGPWERIPNSDQADKCLACGFVSTK